MKKLKKLKFWQIIAIIVGIVILYNIVIPHKKPEREYKAIPKTYIEIPDTSFKTKEQVQEEFNQLGLKVKFIPTNFDDKADKENKTIVVGTTDSIDESQPNVKYFDYDKYGRDFGNYTKKGSTLIVGYSDHVYIRGNASSNAKESQSTQTKTSETPSESTSADVSTKNSGNSEVQELLSEYDTFISKIKDTTNKVSGMSDIEKMNAVTDLIQEQTNITEKYDALKEEDITSEESTKLTNKSIDMLQEYNALITKLQ